MQLICSYIYHQCIINTTSPTQTLNVAYTSGPKLGDFEQDIYTYGEMETDAAAKWKHSDDRITIGKSIHKGRFAEIKEAKLQDGSGSRKVAAKMLLSKIC
jgi:hypothetical protein